MKPRAARRRPATTPSRPLLPAPASTTTRALPARGPPVRQRVVLDGVGDGEAGPLLQDSLGRAGLDGGCFQRAHLVD